MPTPSRSTPSVPCATPSALADVAGCASASVPIAEPARTSVRESIKLVVPFVDRDVLRKNFALVPSDDRFTAACRLMANNWRMQEGLPPGSFSPEPPRKRASTAKPAGIEAAARSSRVVRLGSRLSPAAARAGGNFLTPEIARAVRRIFLLREPGALLPEDRILGNLLSSQALGMNLLIPLALDLDLASTVFRRLIPDLVGRVTAIRFEHSPARHEQGRRTVVPKFLGDATALDVMIDLISPEGEVAFIGIELKYCEPMNGAAAPPKPRYVEAARESGLYRDPEAEILSRPGYDQIKREHVLCSLMLRHGLAGRGRFLLIGPLLNHRVHEVGETYAKQLVDRPRSARDEPVGFSVLSLETVVEAIAAAGASDHAAAFTRRYLDLEGVARFVLDQPMPALAPTARGQQSSKGRTDGGDTVPDAALQQQTPRSGAAAGSVPRAPALGRSRTGPAVAGRSAVAGRLATDGGAAWPGA